MPRILSIDYGQKRTGIAVTDEMQIIASGLTTIPSATAIDFLKDYFSKEKDWETAANKATQIINLQSQHLAKLEENEFLHMRRQLDMQNILNDFYDHQGRAERIKKFPLPRQYAKISFIFNCIFIFLLPLGIVAEFEKLGEAGV